MNKKAITTSTIKAMKQQGEPITMVTAYDVAMARNVNEAGVEMILVGDSVGNVMLGYGSTVPVTMEEMLHHTKAVMRACGPALVVADMPFMSYQASIADGLYNAARFLKETGCTAVKLEGGSEICELVQKMVAAGIPVVGHIGLTPQSVNQMGGFKVQGKDVAAAQKLLDDAKALEAAGAFAIVLECVPAALAAKVTAELKQWQLLVSAPEIPVMGRYWSVMICWDFRTGSVRNLPKNTAICTEVLSAQCSNTSGKLRSAVFLRRSIRLK